jgi:hypothetical protein
MPETSTKKYEKVEFWANHPLTPSSQGRGIDINITGDTPAPARASLDPFKSGFPGIITASFAIHIYLVVCIRDLFHTNFHSAAVAGGTNSYEKMVCGFHHFAKITLRKKIYYKARLGES